MFYETADLKKVEKSQELLVCVCLSPQRFLLTEQIIKYNARVQVSDSMLRKYFWIRVKDNHKKNIQAGNCEEYQTGKSYEK